MNYNQTTAQRSIVKYGFALIISYAVTLSLIVKYAEEYKYVLVIFISVLGVLMAIILGRFANKKSQQSN